MKYRLLLIILTAQIAYGLDNTTSGPDEVGKPNELVTTVYTNAIRQAVDLATKFNEGTPPVGAVAAPFEQIAATNLLQYMDKHPAMIPESSFYIKKINGDPAVTKAWQWVQKTKGEPLKARELALNIYYLIANVPLGREEVTIIPGLDMSIPFMVPVMLKNQDLKLNEGEREMWNAAFAAETSILSSMEATDKEAFLEIFKHCLEESEEITEADEDEATSSDLSKCSVQ